MFDKRVKLTDLKVKSFVALPSTTAKTNHANYPKGKQALLDSFKWNMTVVDIQGGIVNSSTKEVF